MVRDINLALQTSGDNEINQVNLPGYDGIEELPENTNETATQGYVGITGYRGIQGTQGSSGIQGYQGLRGVQGIQGIQGIVGFQGKTGFQGLRGYTGFQGLVGNTGFQGLQGKIGTQGLQGTTGQTGLQGLIGITGTQGLQGRAGLQGLQGLRGRDGVQGVTGTNGSDGLQGISGKPGLQGIRGCQGLQGIRGTTGSQGIQGIKGIQGNSGVQGLQGQNGIQGLQGLRGWYGVQGIEGETGIEGVQGLQGALYVNGMKLDGNNANLVVYSHEVDKLKTLSDTVVKASEGSHITVWVDNDTKQYLSSDDTAIQIDGIDGFQRFRYNGDSKIANLLADLTVSDIAMEFVYKNGSWNYIGIVGDGEYTPSDNARITERIVVKGVEIGGYKTNDTIEVPTKIETIVSTMLRKRLKYSVQEPKIGMQVNLTDDYVFPVGGYFANITANMSYSDGQFVADEGWTGNVDAGCSMSDVSWVVKNNNDVISSRQNTPYTDSVSLGVHRQLNYGNVEISVEGESGVNTVTVLEDNFGDEWIGSISERPQKLVKTFDVRYRVFWATYSLSNTPSINELLAATTGSFIKNANEDVGLNISLQPENGIILVVPTIDRNGIETPLNFDVYNAIGMSLKKSFEIKTTRNLNGVNYTIYSKENMGDSVEKICNLRFTTIY